MFGRLDCRELHLMLSLALVASLELAGCGNARDELLAVLLKPLVGVAAGSPELRKLEFEALGVCAVTPGMVLLQRSVTAQLIALTTGAPSELGCLPLELASALCLLGRRGLVMGLLAFEPKRLTCGVTVELVKCLVLLMYERLQLLIWQISRALDGRCQRSLELLGACPPSRPR
jgi:hypothetical protein